MALALVVRPAQAAVEICGNALDDDSSGTYGACGAGETNTVHATGAYSGCDKLCPEPDKDGDGYHSAGVTTNFWGNSELDCDDSDRRVFPGVHVKSDCTGSNYKTCQTNGSYTSCNTGPLAEGDANYYIDCGSGNDTTGAGTYANPWASFGMVAGGSPGSEPAGAVTLTAGDHVYILGSSNCSTEYSNGTDNVLATFTAAGTSGNEITIKRYPGATANLVASAASLFTFTDTAEYYEINGIDGTTGTSSTPAIYGTGVRYIELKNSWLYDSAGNGDNNYSAFYCDGCLGWRSTLSYYSNINRASGNVDNVSAIKWLDDQDLATECEDHWSKKDVIWWDSYSGTTTGDCFRQKHGCDDEDVGVNEHVISGSYCLNASRFIQWNSSGLRATKNVAQDVGMILYMQNDGSTNPMEDNEFTFNTFINTTELHWRTPRYESTEKLTVEDNIFIDDTGTYNTENGLYVIDRYGTDANKTLFESYDMLDTDRNCFYNASTAVAFNYYGDNGTGGATAGDVYSLTNWKGLAYGFDPNSFEENPSLDTYGRATSSNCANKGFLLLSEEAAQSTPGGFSPWF